jgi:hypothetical protein
VITRLLGEDRKGRAVTVAPDLSSEAVQPRRKCTLLPAPAAAAAAANPHKALPSSCSFVAGASMHQA